MTEIKFPENTSMTLTLPNGEALKVERGETVHLTFARLADLWRPIETAPLDRRILLGWYEGSEFVQAVGAWHRHLDALGAGWTDYVSDAWEEYLRREPTHWQPLPEPPAN